MLFSIVAMVLVQVLWCCRQNNKVMFVPVAAAGVASLVSVITWLIFLYAWGAGYDYEPFTMDDCCGYYELQLLWAWLAFACGALWAGSAFCMLYFVRSGKHAAWEDYHSNKYVKGTRFGASYE